MSKTTIKHRNQTAAEPGFHLYEDTVDLFCAEDDGQQPPVHLRLDGVDAEVHAFANGCSTVTVSLPRSFARELGLLPAADTLRTPPSSADVSDALLVVLRQARNAIQGLIEMAAHRGVKPTDITLTIMSNLDATIVSLQAAGCATPALTGEQLDECAQLALMASRAPTQASMAETPELPIHLLEYDPPTRPATIRDVKKSAAFWQLRISKLMRELDDYIRKLPPEHMPMFLAAGVPGTAPRAIDAAALADQHCIGSNRSTDSRREPNWTFDLEGLNALIARLNADVELLGGGGNG